MAKKATPARIKRCLLKAGKEVTKWRKRLRIDQKWEIQVCYRDVYIDEGVELRDALIIFEDASAEYWTVSLVLLKRLIEDDNFYDDIGSYVSHELDHLRMWQFSSFAKNLCRGDKALMKELVKLEEQVVQQNQEIFDSVKWPR